MVFQYYRNSVHRRKVDTVQKHLPLVGSSKNNIDRLMTSSHAVLTCLFFPPASKLTFLDILARKWKKRLVSGTTLVNGREVPDEMFKKVIGFVDQENTPMSTLTVYETVLYSTLLRLPQDMSLEAKKFRMLETLRELGVFEIKDARIESGERSISPDAPMMARTCPGLANPHMLSRMVQRVREGREV